MSDKKMPANFNIDSNHAQGSVQASTITKIIQNFFNVFPGSQNRKIGQAIVLLSIGIIVFVGAIGLLKWHFDKKPKFVVEKAILRSDDPIVVRAENRFADRNEPITVEFDGISFDRMGIPAKTENKETRSTQKWIFSITDNNPTEEMVKEGYHAVRFCFPGDDFSEKCHVAFVNRPPVLRVETEASLSDPSERVVRGKAASEVPIPGNKIGVEIMYLHDGPPQKINVPVEMKQDEKTGIVYFEFQTTIQGLPQIFPDDPRYSSPFFGFRVTDQAGNEYYQKFSYAQYMAPGSAEFGFNKLAMIKMDKVAEEDAIKNVIHFTPIDVPLQQKLANGEPAIVLDVTGTATGRLLKWKSNVKDRQPITVVLRDDTQIVTSFADEYVDKDKLSEGKVEYRVEQESIDGVKYTSNKVQYAESEKYRLTVRSNVKEDTVFIDGTNMGPTPLNVEIPAGEHALRVEKSGYASHEETIDLKKDMTVRCVLNPAAEIRVETEPSGAVVHVNNKKAGVSPLLVKALKPGEIRIKAELSGFETKEGIFVIGAENPDPIKLTLSSVTIPSGTLFVDVTPADASVKILDIEEPYVRGMELNEGEYEIEASKNSYQTAKKTAKVTAGEKTEITILLESVSVVLAKSRENSVGMKFVLVPSGFFEMGERQVTLSKAFYLQTTEVTQGQWKSIMGDNPSDFKDCGDDCPVENVSWDDVQDFIKKLNRKEGSNKYRLPTEAEWEYAARSGGKNETYAGGENLNELGWYRENSGGKTHPAGQKKPNGLGLYDMSGNVWEWCQDWYGDYTSGDAIDPQGPNDGSDRVLRGGSWGGSADVCRSAGRGGGSPGYRGRFSGFRLVLLPGQQ